MSHVSIGHFYSVVGLDKHRNVWHEICDYNICFYIFMKQHNRDCINFWKGGNYYSNLKHTEVNIQSIIIMLWVEELQEMVHFIIINLFDWSTVWICNIFRVKFKWKLVSTDQCWRPPVSWDHSGRVQRILWMFLFWLKFRIVSLIHHWCDGLFDRWFEVLCEIIHFLIRLLPGGFNCGLHDDWLFIRIIIHLVASFFNLEAWGMHSITTEVGQWLLFGDIWHRWELLRKYYGEISLFRMWFELRKFGRLGDRVWEKIED